MNCVIFLIALTPILFVQGAMQAPAAVQTPEPAPAPPAPVVAGATKPRDAAEVKFAGEEDAAIFNAQANHEPVVQFIIFEHLNDREKCPVQSLPVDLTSGSVKAGEIFGAWATQDIERDWYFPREGDTVDYHERRMWEGAQARMAFAANYQSHFHAAMEDPNPAKTAFVQFSYPWIKKKKVKEGQYELKYVVMVRYKDKHNNLMTSQLGTTEDRYGNSVFNVQKGNAEKYSAELAEMRRQREAEEESRPPRTREGILKIIKMEPHKMELLPKATNDDAINYLMRTHVLEIAGMTNIPFDRVVRTETKTWDGKPKQVVVNKDIQAGEIVSLWSGNDQIFRESPIVQQLKTNEYDLSAFFATYDQSVLGPDALTEQLQYLPKFGDEVLYYPGPTSMSERKAVRGVVYESYRFAGKLQATGKQEYIPYMQVQVYVLGSGGTQTQRTLYQQEPKNPKVRLDACWQHRQGLDMTNDKGLALFRALEEFTNGRGEDFPEELRPAQQAPRGALHLPEGVDSAVVQPRRNFFGFPRRTSVAVSENTRTISNDYYAVGFCFLVVLLFLVKLCRRKPTPEELPLYEPLF